MAENEVITVEAPAVLPAIMPRQETARPHSAALTIEIERAKAEVVAAIQAAKMCPRDEQAARREILAACQNPSLAGKGIYDVPRGSKQARGPSVHLIREMARIWGNLQYGFFEHSNDAEKAEYDAVCWDVQSNTRATTRFTVKHERYTKKGSTTLTDPAQMYENAANFGMKRLRECIRYCLPAHLVDDARAACEATMASGITNLEESRALALAAFNGIGVSSAELERYLGKAWPLVTVQDIVTLRAVKTAIESGESTVTDFFPAKPVQELESAPPPQADPAPETKPEAPAQGKPIEKPAASRRGRKPAAADSVPADPIPAGGEAENTPPVLDARSAQESQATEPGKSADAGSDVMSDAPAASNSCNGSASTPPPASSAPAPAGTPVPATGNLPGGGLW